MKKGVHCDLDNGGGDKSRSKLVLTSPTMCPNRDPVCRMECDNQTRLVWPFTARSSTYRMQGKTVRASISKLAPSAHHHMWSLPNKQGFGPTVGRSGPGQCSGEKVNQCGIDSWISLPIGNSQVRAAFLGCGTAGGGRCLFFSIQSIFPAFRLPPLVAAGVPWWPGSS